MYGSGRRSPGTRNHPAGQNVQEVRVEGVWVQESHPAGSTSPVDAPIMECQRLKWLFVQPKLIVWMTTAFLTENTEKQQVPTRHFFDNACTGISWRGRGLSTADRVGQRTRFNYIVYCSLHKSLQGIATWWQTFEFVAECTVSPWRRRHSIIARSVARDFIPFVELLASEG